MVLSLVMAVATTMALASCEQPRPAGASQPLPKQAADAPFTKPAMPAFRPGMVVHDRAGTRIGAIKTVTETPGGLNVVIEIEGKLVGVLPSTLRLQGETVVSSQTKAEILASAGVPT